MADRDPNFPMQGKRGGMGGKYATKSVDLPMATLRKAGAGKAAKADAVSQSDTRREGSHTVGPDGRPLTGVIELSDGGTAVYLDGRRVQAADARDAGRDTRSGPDKGDGPDGPPPPDPITAKAQRLKDNKGVAAGTIKPGAKGHGVRSYDAESGRWDRIAGVSGATAASSQSLLPTHDGHAPARPASYASGGPSSYTPGGSNGGSGLEGGVRNMIEMLMNPGRIPERAGQGLDRLESGFGRGAGKLPEHLGHGVEVLERIPPRLGRGVDNILGWLPGDR